MIYTSAVKRLITINRIQNKSFTIDLKVCVVCNQLHVCMNIYIRNRLQLII